MYELKLFKVVKLNQVKTLIFNFRKQHRNKALNIANGKTCVAGFNRYRLCCLGIFFLYYYTSRSKENCCDFKRRFNIEKKTLAAP